MKVNCRRGLHISKWDKGEGNVIISYSNIDKPKEYLQQHLSIIPETPRRRGLRRLTLFSLTLTASWHLRGVMSDGPSNIDSGLFV